MNRRRSAFASVVSLTVAAGLYGGTMMVQFGDPNTAAARAQHAVLTFRSVGCHDPETVSYSATAEGVVDGKRSSIPLTLLALDGHGLMGVKREWSKEGIWVVVINAREGEAHWGTVLNPLDLQSASHFRRPVTAIDAATALRGSLPVTAGVKH